MPNEEENKTPAKTVSRRQFLLGTVGGLAIGAAAGAAAGSLGFPKTVTVTEQPWIPSTWDETADVVIIGYGGAGAVTAIAAHDAGANVLVLEKTPSYSALGVSNAKISGGGGNTAMNGGVVVVPLDATAGANHAYYLGLGTTPKAVCKAWADLAVDINKYLDNIGIKYTIMQHTAEMVYFPDA